MTTGERADPFWADLLPMLTTDTLVSITKELYYQMEDTRGPDWTVIEAYHHTRKELEARGVEVNTERVGEQEWEVVISGPEVAIPF